MIDKRTPEVKIVIDYFGGKGNRIEKEYQIRNEQVYRLLEKYEKHGIDG